MCAFASFTGLAGPGQISAAGALAAAAWAVGLEGAWSEHTLTVDGGSLMVADTLINHGTLSQQQAVNGAAVAFFDTGGYGGLMVNPNGQDLGATTVQIRGNQDCTTVPGEAVRRCFDITPGSAPGSGVTLTFTFAASEIPAGQSCAAVEAYHWDGAAWQMLARAANYGTDGRDCAAEPYSIRVTGAAGFSPFVLRSGSAPTAVAVRAFAAAPGLPVPGLIAALGLLAAAAYWLTGRRTRRL